MPTVSYLEKMVSHWEDYWFLINTKTKLEQLLGEKPDFLLEGPVINAPKFRRFLLGGVSGSSNLTIRDFIPSSGRLVTYFDALPWSIAHWSQQSRRVYRLNADLQAVLQATSLERIKWQDVQLPFPSFALELNPPMKLGSNELCGFLLLYTFADDRTPRIVIEAYPPALLSYTPWGFMRRQSLTNLLKQPRKYSRLQQLLEEADDVLNDLHPRFGRFDFGVDPEENVLEAPSKAFQQSLHKSDGVNMARLAIGLALYLKTLPLRSPHLSEARASLPRRKTDSNAITDEAQIFNVTSIIQLTSDERVLLDLEGTAEERARIELSCHFREGYWRRRPGQGADPDAPKVVHVRPTIVRRDKLPIEGLPVGAVKKF